MLTRGYTAPGAGAGGGGGASGPAATGTVRGILGFTASDYLERVSAGALRGNNTDGFEIMVAVMQDRAQGETGGEGLQGTIVSNAGAFTAPGYRFRTNNQRPDPNVADGAGNMFGMFNRAHWGEGLNYRLVFMTLGTDLATRRLTIAGQTVVQIGQSTVGYTPELTLPVRVGEVAGVGTYPWIGLICGLAWKITGYWTAAEIRELMRTFWETGNFGTTLPDHAFDASALSTGAMPGTWPDAVGGLDLSLTGSLTVEDWPCNGHIDFQQQLWAETPQIDNGGLLTSFSTYNTAGPHTPSAHRSIVLSSAAQVAFTLSAFPPNGSGYVILDYEGEAHMRPIIVTRGGTDLINGRTTYRIDRPFSRADLFYYNGNWTASQGQDNQSARHIEDDETFLGIDVEATTGDIIGSRWEHDSASSGAVADIASVAGHPGILELDTGGTATGRATIYRPGGPSGGAGYVFGNGAIFVEFDLRVPTLSTASEEFQLIAGFGQDPADLTPDPGIYFEYDRATHGDDNLRAVNEDAATQTVTDTGVALVAGTWVRLRIALNAAGTAIVFLIDDVIVATHTTNIPSDARSVIVELLKTVGTTSRTVEVDRAEFFEQVA